MSTCTTKSKVGAGSRAHEHGAGIMMTLAGGAWVERDNVQRRLLLQCAIQPETSQAGRAE